VEKMLKAFERVTRFESKISHEIGRIITVPSNAKSPVLSLADRFGAVLDHPVGGDLVRRILLEMGLSFRLVDNIFVRRLKLSTVARIGRRFFGDQLVDTLLTLLNNQPDIPSHKEGDIKPAWWKEAVFYQIYPRSFADSNGDGIGDLNGITSKLDVLKELGVDCLWLSPIFRSPGDDNGYDISDYRDIDPQFGTLADFDRLLAEVHRRGMRLILDLVVNHTSDEHPWFQEAIADPESDKRNYYFLVDGNIKEGGKEILPNNWTSFFSGPAWRYFPEEDVYALHLFSAKQMDLNWEHEQLRQEVYDLTRFWLARGVDGFRLDVINYISKADGLPQGNTFVGDLIGFCGMEHYIFGKNLHRHLRELRREAFEPFKAFSVGETPGVGREMAKLLTAEDRGELDLVFRFDHLENPGKTRFDSYCYDLNDYKKRLAADLSVLGSGDWISLFFENHDNPRMTSKVNCDETLRDPLAKLLIGLLLTTRGTPFLYQGQEIGMGNGDFNSIDEIRDVESLNRYAALTASKEKDEAFQEILAGTRDHARLPVSWNKKANAGFTDGTPWIKTASDCETRNVELQRDDETSVWNFTRNLIALRRAKKTLIYGETSFHKLKKKDYWGMIRKDGENACFIEANLSDKEIRRPVPPGKLMHLLGNCGETKEMLRPYELNVYRLTSL
jgi:oligo-1,6-glucosidase